MNLDKRLLEYKLVLELLLDVKVTLLYAETINENVIKANILMSYFKETKHILINPFIEKNFENVKNEEMRHLYICTFLAHEMYHAYQYQHITSSVSETYTSPATDKSEYIHQPLEIEAHAFQVAFFRLMIGNPKAELFQRQDEIKEQLPKINALASVYYKQYQDKIINVMNGLQSGKIKYKPLETRIKRQHEIKG